MNSRKAAQLMKKMGIQQQEVEAVEVIIRGPAKDIVISSPQVLKVNMMGQETFQVSGRISERAKSVEISEEDIKTVMEKTSASEKDARAALNKSNGDLAEAIMGLQG